MLRRAGNQLLAWCTSCHTAAAACLWCGPTSATLFHNGLQSWAGGRIATSQVELHCERWMATSGIELHIEGRIATSRIVLSCTSMAACVCVVAGTYVQQTCLALVAMSALCQLVLFASHSPDSCPLLIKHVALSSRVPCASPSLTYTAWDILLF